MNRIFPKVFLFSLCAAVLFDMHIKPDCQAGNRVHIFTSIPPLAFLVERVGGPHIKVQALTTQGGDPHTFEPSPRQLIELGKAHLFFKIGLPLETRVVEKIQTSSRRLRVIDIAAGIERRRITAQHHGEDKDNEEKGVFHETEGETDPHVWLSPPLAKVLAKNIARALIDIDPLHADDYNRNLTVLNEDIDRVNAKIKKALEPFAGQAFFVFHPAFGYFGKAYGLRQKAVELEGKSPSPKQLAAFIKAAKSDKAKIVFVQPQFDKTNANIVAQAINGVVVPLDPMAEDLLGNFTEMANKLAQALK